MMGACSDAKGTSGTNLDFPAEQVHGMQDCVSNIDNDTIKMIDAP
jgi:hypothetical protein